MFITLTKIDGKRLHVRADDVQTVGTVTVAGHSGPTTTTKITFRFGGQAEVRTSAGDVMKKLGK